MGCLTLSFLSKLETGACAASSTANPKLKSQPAHLRVEHSSLIAADARTVEGLISDNLSSGVSYSGDCDDTVASITPTIISRACLKHKRDLRPIDM